MKIPLTKKITLTIPTAIVAAAMIVGIALVLTWGPDDARSKVLQWIGWAIAFVSQFLPALLQKSAAPDPKLAPAPPDDRG